MSAEERLRRYLEQRRELGERELILDGMSVDEVMRIIGAGPGGGATSGGAGGAAPRNGKEEDAAAQGRLPEGGAAPGREGAAERAGSAPPPATADWREALRAAGADLSPTSKLRGSKPSRAESTPGDPPRATGPAFPALSDPPPADPPPDSQAEPGRPPLDVPPGIVVGARLDDEPVPEIAACQSLEAIAGLVAGCQRCDLYRTATHPVPGDGIANARVMCIGEAPGAREDATGHPFVGAAGELLTKILAAVNLKRDEVFITNVLKHRPPGNRNPLPVEVEACRPYLVRQVALIRPTVIITFGAFAAQTLLDTKLAIGKLRGAVHRYHGIPVVVTYHPAALLRNPAWKRPTWEDVQLARRILDNSSA